jgi:hypothetical protein
MAKDFICVLLMAIVAAFPLLFSVKYVTMKVVELQGPAGLDTLYNVYLPLHLSLLAAAPASAARASLVGFDDVPDVTETDRKYYIVVVALTAWVTYAVGYYPGGTGQAVVVALAEAGVVLGKILKPMMAAISFCADPFNLITVTVFLIVFRHLLPGVWNEARMALNCESLWMRFCAIPCEIRFAII